jgi:hypothetical protein
MFKAILSFLLPDYIFKNAMNPDVRSDVKGHINDFRHDPKGTLNRAAESVKAQVEFDPKNPKSWGTTLGQLHDVVTPEQANSRQIDAVRQGRAIENHLSTVDANAAALQNGKHTHVVISNLPGEVLRGLENIKTANGRSVADHILDDLSRDAGKQRVVHSQAVGGKVIDSFDLANLKDVKAAREVTSLLQKHGIDIGAVTKDGAQAAAAGTATSKGGVQGIDADAVARDAGRSGGSAAGTNTANAGNAKPGVQGVDVDDVAKNAARDGGAAATGALTQQKHGFLGRTANTLANNAGRAMGWAAAINTVKYGVMAGVNKLMGRSEAAAEYWDATKSYAGNVGMMAIMGQAMKRVIPMATKGLQTVSLFGRSIPGVAAVGAIIGGVIETGVGIKDVITGQASIAKPIHSLVANTIEGVVGFFGGPAGMAARQGYVELIRRFTPTDPQNVPWDCAAVAAVGAVKSVFEFGGQQADATANPLINEGYRKALGQQYSLGQQISAPVTPARVNVPTMARF